MEALALRGSSGDCARFRLIAQRAIGCACVRTVCTQGAGCGKSYLPGLMQIPTLPYLGVVVSLPSERVAPTVLHIGADSVICPW